MNIEQLPFNSLLGIRKSEEESTLLTLPFSEGLTNHLENVHASAIFALAEASSGEFLLRQRDSDSKVGGVVRKASCKYSAPARSSLNSSSPTDPEVLKQALLKVEEKGRALVTIEVLIQDESEKLIGKFTFDWLLVTEDQTG